MIGVLGKGQLGRMLALAGKPLGESFAFLDPSDGASVRGLGDISVTSFEDAASMSALGRKSNVVTYEFESVPAGPVQRLATEVAVYPPPRALEVSQDRLAEKSFFESLGIPTAAFRAVDDEASLRAAVLELGVPCFLKTRRGGYDGKGQVRITRSEDIAPAWSALGGAPLILEKHVPFERELSVLAVRNRSGEERFYPLVENHHEGGILRMSLAPAPSSSAALESQARAYAERILRELAYVGVLAIELFEVGGALLVNEMAPRVHNSGHYSIEGAQTSQFENHLRAILDLPLGDTTSSGPCTMLNLIGGIPPRDAVLAVPGAHLHLYGKEPKPGRKVGHITICARTREALDPLVARLTPIVAAATR